MANIPLQSISFPGLSDKYTTPTVDATLTQTGAAADAKKTGDELAGLKNDLNQLESVYSAFVVETETGAIASFTDGAEDVPVKDLTVAIEPVQSGSGDPSPTNIRQISGWTGANVTAVGKNILNEALIRQGSYTSDTQPNNCAALNIPIKGGQTYTWSQNVTSAGRYIRFADADGVERDESTRMTAYATSTYTFIAPSWANFISLVWYSGGPNITPTDVKSMQPQLELGSTATAYEPYQGETYEVDWTTEAGTVYGGTLDVTTGVLTVDRAVITMDGTQSIGNNGALSYGGIQVVATPSPAKKLGATNAEGLLSDKFKIADIAEPYTLTGRTSNANLVFNMPTDVTSIELAKTWFTNNPTQVSYLLATPQTYQLTPQEVSTILGQNNIFADTGNSTVQYRADTKLYIDKVLSA